MQRVAIWIDSERFRPGEAAQVYGPAADGSLDASAGEPGGRIVVIPRAQHFDAGYSEGPAGVGTDGAERAARLVYSRELPTGLHEFAVGAFAADTGAAGTVGPLSHVYVNTFPRAPRGLRPVGMVSGRMRFRFLQVEQ